MYALVKPMVVGCSLCYVCFYDSTGQCWLLAKSKFAVLFLAFADLSSNRLCGLVARVPGCRSRGQGSISGATRFSEKYWAWNGVCSAL
jgi:hypothetical protein